MKILDTSVLSSMQPRLVELSDKLAINGHIYDKTSLTPDKMSFLELTADTLYMLLNDTGVTSRKNVLTYDNVIQDKQDPNNTFLIANTNTVTALVKIVKNAQGKYTVAGILKETTGNSMYEYLSQDGLFIYYFVRIGINTYIRKVNKQTMGMTAVHINGITECKANVIHINDTDIYFVASFNYDEANVYKYQKQLNTLTLLKSDRAVVPAKLFNSYGVQDSKNSMLMARNEKSFSGDAKIIIKRYIIDSYEQKVYDKIIKLDCSILPGNKIPIMMVSDFYDGWRLERFVKNNDEYLILYELVNHKKLYLLKKTRDDEYIVIQEIATGLSYNGLMIYNNGRTLIVYNQYQIGFYTFSDYEERYELTHSEFDTFDCLGIDKSQRIWVKNNRHEVMLLTENNPIKAEVNFELEEVEFKNTPIETTLNVYAKSFTGGMITADVEIILNGAIRFTDTGTQIKKIKTSASMPTSIPVTIYGSGLVEASASII